MKRFDKSCIRAFFTLPKHLLELPNSFVETKYSKPFNEELRTASSMIYNETKFFPIWFDNPDDIKDNQLIDLSFRDFSDYNVPPVVLIRKSSTS